MPEPAEPIRILIADDAYVIREGIAAALETEPEIEVVAMCADGDELRAAIGTTHPEVVITDARMPPSGEGEGVRIAARLRETAPEIGVILLTQYIESAYAIALMDGGTSRRAYLLKDHVASRAQLLDVIRSVAAGGSVIDPLVVEALIQGRVADPASAIDQLTPREQEI